MRTADAPSPASDPATTAKNGGKATAEIKTEEQVAAHCIRRVNGRHVVTLHQSEWPAASFYIPTKFNQHDRAEAADNKGQNIEVAHKSGSVERRLLALRGHR
ncbi:hypothetical protein [Klebsiella pneumoniae]|uniref:hypothetical protein n=1 Tax=Klebsiella pneumoniae TaxID=573 RepID=UPI001F4629E8